MTAWRLRPGTMTGRIAGAIVLVATVVLLASGGVAAWAMRDAHLRTITDLQVQRAGDAAGRIGDFITGIDARLRWLIEPAWSSLTEDDRAIDAMRLLRAVPAVNALQVIDPRGRERIRVAQLALDAVGEGPDLSADPAYRLALQAPRSLGPVTFRDGSEPYARLFTRAREPESGMVIADINLKFIWDAIVSIRIGARGVVYVVDETGQLIAHPDIGLVLGRTDVSSLPHVRAALGDARAAGELTAGRDLAGEPITSAYAQVPGTGWRVVTEVPTAEALAPLRATLPWLAAALAAGLIGAYLLALAIARAMVAPIRTLADGAARIGAGDLDHRITPSGAGEMIALGRAFNSMTERLGQAYATLEAKVRERTAALDRASQAKSRFIASASHDLRQPLHALGLFAEELRAGPEPPRRDQVVANLAAAVASLQDMFESILDTSRIEAGAISATLADVPLARVLAPLETMFAAPAAAKGLAFDLPITDAWVRTDPVLLQRILQNVVSNAVRYTTAGGVTVTCAARDDRVEIEVSDTGPGIPDAIRGEVFGEYVRGHGGGERSLGLGLFIVERFAGELALTWDMRSDPAGTRFTFILPRAAPAAAPPPIARPPGAGLRALAVDDDPHALAALAGLLRAWAFDVTTAEAAGPALTVAATGVDLIVTDLDLGGPDNGLDVIEAARAARPAARAILVTGDPTRVPPGDPRLEGVPVLAKPVAPSALRALVSGFPAAPRPAD